MVRTCKKNYPYIPSSDQRKCGVCGHLGVFHTHLNGVSKCYKCKSNKPSNYYKYKKKRKKKNPRWY